MQCSSEAGRASDTCSLVSGFLSEDGGRIEERVRMEEEGHHALFNPCHFGIQKSQVFTWSLKSTSSLGATSSFSLALVVCSYSADFQWKGMGKPLTCFLCSKTPAEPTASFSFTHSKGLVALAG